MSELWSISSEETRFRTKIYGFGAHCHCVYFPINTQVSFNNFECKWITRLNVTIWKNENKWDAFCWYIFVSINFIKHLEFIRRGVEDYSCFDWLNCLNCIYRLSQKKSLKLMIRRKAIVRKLIFWILQFHRSHRRLQFQTASQRGVKCNWKLKS